MPGTPHVIKKKTQNMNEKQPNCKMSHLTTTFLWILTDLRRSNELTYNEARQKTRFNVAHGRYYRELKSKYSLSKVIKFGKEILEDSRFVSETKRIISTVIEKCVNFFLLKSVQHALSNSMAILARHI